MPRPTIKGLETELERANEELKRLRGDSLRLHPLSQALTANEQALTQAIVARDAAYRERDSEKRLREELDLALTASHTEHGDKDAKLNALKRDNDDLQRELRLAEVRQQLLHEQLVVAREALSEVAAKRWLQSIGVSKVAKETLAALERGGTGDDKFAEPEEGVDGSGL